jgi:hypothetical protein
MASPLDGKRIINDKHRAANLCVALGFLRLKPGARELNLHRWLDTWSGIGLFALGMYRQGYRLSLTHGITDEWRAACPDESDVRVGWLPFLATLLSES